MKIIECVPNFSEGRDTGKIKEIVAVLNHFRMCGWPISVVMPITTEAFLLFGKA